MPISPTASAPPRSPSPAPRFAASRPNVPQALDPFALTLRPPSRPGGSAEGPASQALPAIVLKHLPVAMTRWLGGEPPPDATAHHASK